MTIAVIGTPVTGGQYSAHPAVTPVPWRPLDRANQRLEHKYGEGVERNLQIDALRRTDGPDGIAAVSVDQKSDRRRMSATRA
jgi:hypothetical protein